MPGDAPQPWAALRDDNTQRLYFRLTVMKSGIAAFCPHGRDMGFDHGLGPARKLARKAASFREFPNQGLERV